MKGLRQKIAFAHDLVMAALSFPLALLLRLGFDVFSYDVTFIVKGTLLFTIAAGVSFLSLRLYSGVWRYASINDLTAITKAVTLAILIFLPVMFLLTRLESRYAEFPDTASERSDGTLEQRSAVVPRKSLLAASQHSQVTNGN